MESSNELIQKLAFSFKRYLRYQEKYIKLDLTEKFSILLTVLILGGILFVIGLIALIFLALTAAAALKTWLGSFCAAYAIVAVFFLLLCLIIYWTRKKWIVEPLTKFFSKLFLENNKDSNIREDHE